MEKYFLFFLLIQGGFSTFRRIHILKDYTLNWTGAQSYCRKNYKDLSTVSSQEENSLLLTTLQEINSHAWIGLFRNNSNLDQFIWSDGDLLSKQMYWKSNQPDGRSRNQYCVETDKTGWADYTCDDTLRFFCYSMVLVRENRTWGEAMEYCRDHYTDLASLKLDEFSQIRKNLANESSVWVGLSFVAGQWYWLNTQTVGRTDSLPDCPDKNRRCGAFNRATGKLENRNCKESLSFLCY